ncbi:MAG: hypothetical protein ACLP22_21030 [Solirubrobacteraceae bacterium]
MSFSRRRIAAIAVKELRDYRHNRFVIGTMAFLPVLFIALPIVQLLIAPAAEPSSKLDARVGLSLLYLLLIPAFVPSTLAAYFYVLNRRALRRADALENQIAAHVPGGHATADIRG